MRLKLQIPNLLTIGNLLCGVYGIQQAYYGNFLYASILIGVAIIFDFFDGFAARMLKVSSPIGKELDSLADLVSFGVLPGVIAMQLAAIAVGGDEEFSWLKYVCYCIPAFSAYRLAKFNVDERQTTSFIGLPTPAHAMFWASIPVISAGTFEGLSGIHTSGPFLNEALFSNYYTVPALALVFSVLLVAEIPLIALKFQHFGWAGNENRYSLIILSVILFLVFGFAAVPLIILLYLVLSTVTNIKGTP